MIHPFRSHSFFFFLSLLSSIDSHQQHSTSNDSFYFPIALISIKVECLSHCFFFCSSQVRFSSISTSNSHLHFSVLHAYEQSLTPWFCTKPTALDSSVETPPTLASCLPGFAIDIEDVVYESTTDGECSGRRLCSLHNKNTLTFACNQKTLCNLKIGHLRYHINSTCGSTVRFYIKYRCLPVIQEQKDYICDSSSRRAGQQSADINLSCENNYRLYIKMALVGISVRPQGESTRTRFQCNKDTYWLCNHYVPDAYRNVCTNQLNRGYGSQCEIRYNDRPRLKGCPYGEASNFSLVEYLCIPSK